MLNLDSCKRRQKRLLEQMQNRRLDWVLLANPKTIYYFSGVLVDAALPQAFALHSSGRSLLVTNQEPKQSAVNRIYVYTAYTLQHPFNRTTMLEELVRYLRQGVVKGVVAWEEEHVPAVVSRNFETPAENITPVIAEMRRIKDEDELEAIRQTIRLTEAGYAAVHGWMAPGLTEYEVYARFQEAVISHAQTSVDLRGDFACGTRAIHGGGPPTMRRLAPGDLYILDIFPFYNGYHCDLCRTFAVEKPSSVQKEAWQMVFEAHKLVQRLIRPGEEATRIYHVICTLLDSFQPAAGSFHHHLGHGVGMDGWEYPWLIPGSEQLIQQGEVLAIEPGLYGENLHGGVRLERNYLVEKDGITPLDEYPLEL